MEVDITAQEAFEALGAKINEAIGRLVAYRNDPVLKEAHERLIETGYLLDVVNDGLEEQRVDLSDVIEGELYCPLCGEYNEYGGFDKEGLRIHLKTYCKNF